MSAGADVGASSIHVIMYVLVSLPAGDVWILLTQRQSAGNFLIYVFWFDCCLRIPGTSGACIHISTSFQTDAYSLLFNASYLCRLQFSMGLNFINVMHLSGQGGTHTAFEAMQVSFRRVKVHSVYPLTLNQNGMSVAGSVGSNLNNFLPLVILFTFLAAYFRVYARISRKLGIAMVREISVAWHCLVEQTSQFLVR
jgi:hypothetical protein